MNDVTANLPTANLTAHRAGSDNPTGRTTSAGGAGSTGRAANVGLWTLQVLAAAEFIFAALPKLTADAQSVAGFAAMGLGNTGMYLIGALELLGALALLIPRLSGLAGLAFVGLMIGAVVITLAMFGPGPLVAVPAVTLVIVAVIAWGRRRRTVELVNWLRRR